MSFQRVLVPVVFSFSSPPVQFLGSFLTVHIYQRNITPRPPSLCFVPEIEFPTMLYVMNVESTLRQVTYTTPAAWIWLPL